MSTRPGFDPPATTRGLSIIPGRVLFYLDPDRIKAYRSNVLEGFFVTRNFVVILGDSKFQELVLKDFQEFFIFYVFGVVF